MRLNAINCVTDPLPSNQGRRNRLAPHNGFGICPRPGGRDRPGLSVADRRRLQELLHQQMWCWGRDVLASRPGNLLVWAGMTRHAIDPPGQRGSTRYSIAWPGGQELSLWAFGVAVLDRDVTIFLHRYTRGVRLLPAKWRPAGVRTPEDLPPLRRPLLPHQRARSSRLLDLTMRWIERYERAVLEKMGSAYRTQTLNGWEHSVVPGPAMANEWRRLAQVHRRAASARPWI